MCLDESVLSIWSGKNWDFQFAKKFRNKDLKWPAIMCRSRNSTPKQKKLLEKMSPYEEDIAVWKSLLLLFFLNHGHAPKNQKALDFASDVRFGWNKNWSGVFWPSKYDANIIFAPASFNLHLQNISPMAWWPIFSKK